MKKLDIMMNYGDVCYGCISVQSDMADKREVSNGEGEMLARNLKCPFFETSAKLRIHIDECFHELVREIKKVQLEKNRELTDKKKGKGGNCVVL